MTWLRASWRDGVRVLRAMPVGQLGVRLLLVATGGLAFGLLPDRGGSLAGVVAWLGLVAVPAAAVRPGGDGPAVVVGGLAASWVIGYGGHLPPMGATVLLGALLYLHHVAAAYAAATPATAMPDRSVVRRWSVPLLAGLLALVAAAAAAYGTRQLPLSPVLQLAGLAGVLGIAGVVAVLARR